MPEIENWGFNYENETMKGYVLYALKLIGDDYPELKLSEEQKEILLKALNWATSDRAQYATSALVSQTDPPRV